VAWGCRAVPSSQGRQTLGILILCPSQDASGKRPAVPSGGRRKPNETGVGCPEGCRIQAPHTLPWQPHQRLVPAQHGQSQGQRIVTKARFEARRGRGGGGRVYVPPLDRHNVTTRINIGHFTDLDRHTNRHRPSQIPRTVTKSGVNFEGGGVRIGLGATEQPVGASDGVGSGGKAAGDCGRSKTLSPWRERDAQPAPSMAE
jgi:hypothetical protein